MAERIEFARRFIVYTMRDCKRKDGSPTWEHAMRVAQAVRGHGEHDVLVALLHDVLEDTKVLTDTLTNLFGVRVAQDVLVLTRTEGETYTAHIDYIRTHASPTVRRVKIADLQDNLRDVDRWAPTLRPRYESALQLLTSR